MNLPPKYYLMHYDAETGEILSFHNPMRGKPDVSPTLTVSLDDHVEVQRNPSLYRVVDGKLVSVDEDAVEEPRPIVDMPSAIIGGLVVDNVCYALESISLSVMLLDLSTNAAEVRAITHTATGTQVNTLTREDALRLAETISEHLVGLHLG